jgi:hypothetical protein
MIQNKKKNAPRDRRKELPSWGERRRPGALSFVLNTTAHACIDGPKESLTGRAGGKKKVRAWPENTARQKGRSEKAKGWQGKRRRSGKHRV